MKKNSQFVLQVHFWGGLRLQGKIESFLIVKLIVRVIDIVQQKLNCFYKSELNNIKNKNISLLQKIQYSGLQK